MQRKKLLIILLALAAVIVMAMLAVLLLAQQPSGAPAATAGDPLALDAVPETPQVTLPLAGPTVAPTISPEALLPTEEDTPVNTVKRYLDRWNAKDSDGMDACLIESHRGQRDYELENVDSIEVLRIAEQDEQAAQENFPEDLAGSVYAIAYVLTDYTVHYSEVGKSFFLVDYATREGYKFWLVQETEGSPWLIALQGY